MNTSEEKKRPVASPAPVSGIEAGNASQYNFLALGDSYTIGESVPEADRWCVQLAELLRGRGIDVGNPDMIARTGWTTAELASAIEAKGNHGKYSIVSLLIGVNNQYRGQRIETYRLEFRKLVEVAIAFANDDTSRVFVLSIPDWGVTPFASSADKQKIANEIDAFNAVAEEECKLAGIVFIDITSLSRTAEGNPSLVATDRLHFSGEMYARWARAALPVVEKMLE